MDSFEKLRGFLEWRRKLHGVAVNEDEAVFAGCFLTHGPFDVPDGAALLQLNADYADIFEAEYFRRKGKNVKIPDENIGPPVFSSVERVGDEITFKIEGKVKDVLNIRTGESRKPSSRKRTRSKHDKVGRNDPCPCGSGKKFKKCCMRVN
jgi:SEC-C motif